MAVDSEKSKLVELLGVPEQGDTIERIVPFGAQYLEKPQMNNPGPVEYWSWKPEVKIQIDSNTASWPGTTGTGPKANEDERYGENQ